MAQLRIKRSLGKTFFVLGFVSLPFLSAQQCAAFSSQKDKYRAVPALIDLRSTFSDGSHTIEELVHMARSRGFKVLFINDHDRIALSYGIPPFRNILRYKKESPSIMTHGPHIFIEEIKRISRRYPDMIIIPGCETSAFYYWTGSWFTKNLTVHGYDRRITIINFNNPDDYRLMPNLNNSLSLKYTKQLLPWVVVFLIPLTIGVILLKWKGSLRFTGLFLIIFSILSIIDYNPFRSSLFRPYDGDQGIAPYQELIDYVNQRKGLCFWNYPEQRSGIRKHGPIYVDTPPYPEVLYQSKDYTGFAAIYGDNITVTDPGREWDQCLNEYCRGERTRPPWGIATADFHEDGRLGLKLGAFPTTLLVKEFSKKGILEALEKGRIYCSRSDRRGWPRLDYFTVSGKENEEAIMGETLKITHLPTIRFRISYNTERSVPITILLIRGGELIHTFRGETPMEVNYIDKEISPGIKTYYRLVDTKNHLTSNPIFVRYERKSVP